MSQTFEDKALYRIRGTGGGWAFSPRDFLDLGGRSTVDSALHRLEKRGEIRRVIRGIYDYPRFSKLLDQSLSPDIDQVARALARKFRWRIQPSGATALNFLGLSTQVPARAVYLSDGPDRVYQIGNTTLAFEHTALKESGIKLKESGLIVQALKSLGQERIANLTLLRSVVEFKERFYYSSWARYDLAIPGSFRLSPPDGQLPALERDYRAMRDMFYREPPTFGAILAGLVSLEQEINAEKRAR
jgi:hypothetical protein